MNFAWANGRKKEWRTFGRFTLNTPETVRTNGERSNEQRGTEEMTSNVQQPSEHPRWEAFMSSFKQSNYITDFWNWFMTLMSKAAEMVLFGTVLYSGYQLLPAVPHVPATIDAAVFVVQQWALPIAAIALFHLANHT